MLNQNYSKIFSTCLSVSAETPVGIACDIKEMYLQIEIEEQDRYHFRLLWRDLDPSREPDVFEFSRVVFGKNSAPMESQFVAQENARRN